MTSRLDPPTHPKRNLLWLQERLLRLHQGTYDLYVFWIYEVPYITLFNVEIDRNVDTLFHFQPSFTRREDS